MTTFTTTDGAEITIDFGHPLMGGGIFKCFEKSKVVPFTQDILSQLVNYLDARVVFPNIFLYSIKII